MFLFTLKKTSFKIPTEASDKKKKFWKTEDGKPKLVCHLDRQMELAP